MLTRSAFRSSLPSVARASAKPHPYALTVHQVVAHNVYKARTLRGWTQQQAADAISTTLGKPLTAAGLSAIEKTFTSRRQRVIDVAELVAYARAFGLPIAWFFLPPEGRETHPIPPTYQHAATMAVDTFGDEDAWQWYIARIVALLGAPRSILHDELLGSAGYPSADEWEAIDRKREATPRRHPRPVQLRTRRPPRHPHHQPHRTPPADRRRRPQATTPTDRTTPSDDSPTVSHPSASCAPTASTSANHPTSPPATNQPEARDRGLDEPCQSPCISGSRRARSRSSVTTTTTTLATRPPVESSRSSTMTAA